MVWWAPAALGLTSTESRSSSYSLLQSTADGGAAAVFKDAEGRNIFTYFISCLYESSSSLLQFIFFLFPPSFYVFLESVRWKILTGRLFALCCYMVYWICYSSWSAFSWLKIKSLELRSQVFLGGKEPVESCSFSRVLFQKYIFGLNFQVINWFSPCPR